MDRIIGEICGDESGPLIILLGSLHGNETAGIKAIENVFSRIEKEKIRIKGRIIGIKGNIQAYQARKRFIDYDLNRAWTEEQINRLKNNGKILHFKEDSEMLDLIHFFETILDYNQEEKICVDLHTTSSENGNFIVVPEYNADHPVIRALKLPLILDLEKHIKGTLLSYLGQRRMLSFAFEGGMIGSEIAIKLHIAGIWEILITAGTVQVQQLNGLMQIGALLQTFAAELPYKLRVKYHYWITQEEEFRMKPGFINFQKVKQGDIIAEDRNGEIIAPMDGLIFMPLYQRSGNDGFFIVEALDQLE